MAEIQQRLIEMILSIVVPNISAMMTKLSIFGTAVPLSHLYTAFLVVNPQASCISFGVTPAEMHMERILSPVAATSIVGIVLSPFLLNPEIRAVGFEPTRQRHGFLKTACIPFHHAR